ncbi:MAG: MBL fold metallo-hydrolase [Chloroflexi bacterium]|nr:MBL fold metallo-hydrolase [Chloroflexota bacterium]MBI3931467.1 MBL fold metallo-hydrolase [Chloroflexota bacterium]
MQKITANVYAETGFQGCNVGFVVTREGVVMIDTPQMPADAIKWRDEIAQYGPVRYLINTEPHGDHITGNYFFEGTVIAHEGTREAVLAASVAQLKERLRQTAPESLALVKNYRYRPPTITLSQRLTLYVGDHTFRLTHLPGHTPYQVAVYIPEERVVFTSDNIFYKVPSALREAVPYGWLDSLKQLQEMEADVLVPGHGELCDRSYLPQQSAIIQAWIDMVTTAMNQGMSLEEAQDKLPFIDPYTREGKNTPMGQQRQRLNVARLYQVLKK